MLIIASGPVLAVLFDIRLQSVGEPCGTNDRLNVIIAKDKTGGEYGAKIEGVVIISTCVETPWSKVFS